MYPSTARPVVFLPGGIMPAALQYQPLLNVLQGEVQSVLKDLEVYGGDTPPADYDLGLEVEGLRRTADSLGLQRFGLVGYSGGGAVALAFIAKYPERVSTLALTEPAVIPSPEWLRQEPDFAAEMARVMGLPPSDQMREFIRANLRPGVQPPPPPPGPPPPWMARRPAGLRAMWRAFNNYDLDLSRLRQFRGPAYLAIGSLTNSIEERKAETLGALWGGLQVEVYEGRHHFDPPQRAEPERFARGLRALWARDISQPGA